MEKIDLELKNDYLDQSRKDIDKFSLNNFRLSNQNFSRDLYRQLSNKYFWRDWLVVVSTHTQGRVDAHSRFAVVGSSNQRTEQRILSLIVLRKTSLLLISTKFTGCVNRRTEPVKIQQRTYHVHSKTDALILIKWVASQVRPQIAGTVEGPTALVTTIYLAIFKGSTEKESDVAAATQIQKMPTTYLIGLPQCVPRVLHILPFVSSLTIKTRYTLLVILETTPADCMYII